MYMYILLLLMLLVCVGSTLLRAYLFPRSRTECIVIDVIREVAFLQSVIFDG